MPKGRTSPRELEIKSEIDKIYTDMPYYGVKRMSAGLRQSGHAVGEKLVRRCFKVDFQI